VFHLGQAGRREVLHLAGECGDAGVREPVVDPDPVAAGGDQPGAGQHPQLSGGVGHLHLRGPGQVLDAALALGEQVQQLQPGRVGQRLADPGELLVQGHLPCVVIAIAAFVVVFGFTTAITNAVGGAITARYTRKTILIAGWVIGLPVPFVLAWGPAWAWVIAANVLLGVHQGLTWSMTVNMKIDLIGPGRRGVALGINETAGYPGVAVTALATGYLATWSGLRPAPELLGAGYAAAGLALSVLAVRDTAAWAAAEARQHPRQAGPHPSFREIAWRVSWVVLPVLLVDHGVSVTGVGYIKALYPFMWAAGMIATGHLADRIGRKPPIVAGMLIQAAGLAVIAAGISHALAAGLAGAFLLGAGTSLVYPTLLAGLLAWTLMTETHPRPHAGQPDLIKSTFE
jgi:MFS family permease